MMPHGGGGCLFHKEPCDIVCFPLPGIIEPTAKAKGALAVNLHLCKMLKLSYSEVLEVS
jgi:hypothetical protein